MVRMRAPQRFPLGTRVAMPIEGRTGKVTAFDMDSGVYTLSFSDGFTHQVDANKVGGFVIKTAPSAAAAAASQSTTSDSNRPPSDPNSLLGAMVAKTVRSYEGKESVMTGHVSAYFDDVGKFRVLFADGIYDEMTRKQVEEAMALQAASEGKKRRHEEKDATASSSKKAKATSLRDGSTASGATAADKADAEQETEQERPLNTMKFDTRSMAYTAVRKILTTILEQRETKSMRTEQQVKMLLNDDIKPKRALEGFVEAGGLRALQKVIQLWIRTPATHAGVMLVLKVLAMLPGITPDLLLNSNIAQTLRSIERASKDTDFVDQSTGDLARWIIRNWKTNVIKRTVTPSPRDLLTKQAGQIQRVTASSASISLTYHRKPTPQKEETARLVSLLNGKDDREHTAQAGHRRPEKQQQTQEQVVYLPQFNSLGSEDARRPVRQIKLVDSVAHRIITDFGDGVRMRDDSDNPEVEIDDSIVTPGRMIFGKPQLWQFDRETPVAELFATARSKLQAKSSSSSGSTSEARKESPTHSNSQKLPPPNKLQAPKRSILKRTADEVLPASEVRWD